MTLQEWLQKGEERLRAGPHPERARRDAELLLLTVLRQDRAALLARRKERLDEEEAARYVDLVERRRCGEPIQYIVGETEFYGLQFRVTPNVLIPRPETEHVVEKALELAAPFAYPRIVDVGTGTGAITVALAHHLRTAQIAATDLSEAALEVARDNAKTNGVGNRIRSLHGDLLAPVAEERFDIVVSNPPYVPTSDRASLAAEVRDYEPPLALFAGEDGLDVYRRLIPDAFSALVSGGFIALEIGFGQAEAIRALLTAAGFEHIEFTPDLQGILRVATAQRPRLVD